MKSYLAGWAVILLAVSASAAEPELEARAVIKSLDRATLSGELTGKILRIPKRMGETFHQGDNLLMLDCSVYVAQKDKVIAERNLARTKVSNARVLNKLRSIGAMDLAIAEAELHKTEAELHIAELNTERCVIKAPYDGRVVNVMVNEHEMVGQQPLIEIVGTRRLEAEIVVPAHTINQLKIGAPVILKVDETAQEIQTSISYISPVIDPVSQTLLLRASLPVSANIMPGMSATAHIPEP